MAVSTGAKRLLGRLAVAPSDKRARANGSARWPIRSARTVAATASADRPMGDCGRRNRGRTEQNRPKSPTARRARDGTARSGRPIREPPSCAASDGVQAKNATDSQRHRQTMTQIQMLKRQTATQALELAALRWNGRTDDAQLSASHRVGPYHAQPARSRSGCRSASPARQDSDRSHRAEHQAVNRRELWRLAWQCVPRASPRPRQVQPPRLTHIARRGTQSKITAPWVL